MDLTTDEIYPLPVTIAGIGRYLPRRVVTNNELEDKYELEPGWCAANTGVKQRYWAAEETPSFMGAAAAREAVTAAGLDLEEIDLIINASTTANFEKLVPDGGPLLQRELGLTDSGIPCFTLQNNFLSFIHALDVSVALLITGRYRNILVVTAELFSFNLDFSNPWVYSRFGDGAAAAVLTLTPENGTGSIDDLCLQTFGEGAAAAQSAIGQAIVQGRRLSPADLSLRLEMESFNRWGHTYLPHILERYTANPIINEIQWVIPPQSGNFSALVHNTLPGKQFLHTLDRFGYCGAATIPMTLYEAVTAKQLGRGQRVLALDIGAGISLGGMIMTY